MLVAMIDGCTRKVGKQQGYLCLPICEEKDNEGNPLMRTAWEPTPEEMIKIAMGAKIEILIMGTQHPPISVLVGDVPTLDQ